MESSDTKSDGLPLVVLSGMFVEMALVAPTRGKDIREMKASRVKPSRTLLLTELPPPQARVFDYEFVTSIHNPGTGCMHALDRYGVAQDCHVVRAICSRTLIVIRSKSEIVPALVWQGGE